MRTCQKETTKKEIKNSYVEKGIQPKIVKIPLTSQMANQALVTLKPIST